MMTEMSTSTSLPAAPANLHASPLLTELFVRTVQDGSLYFLNRISDVNASRACLSTVEDRPAAPHAVAVAQDAQALTCSLIPAIKDKPVCIDDRCRTHPFGVGPY